MLKFKKLASRGRFHLATRISSKRDKSAKETHDVLGKSGGKSRAVNVKRRLSNKRHAEETRSSAVELVPLTYS